MIAKGRRMWSNDDDFEDETLTPEQEAALPYARYMVAGFRVMPLHRILEMPGHALGCGCGHVDCKAVGKHPVASAWQHTPAWDAEQVEAMRMMGQLYPAVGVLVTGWLVVDVDERNGGHESIERLERALGVAVRASSRFVVRTGSGGQSAHYYFKPPQDGASYRQNLQEYPGLDFKTSGFVVGYGSPHASGRDYELLRGDPTDTAEAPAALLQKLAQANTYAGVVNGVVREVKASELSAIADAVQVDKLTYEQWIECGMALHHTTGGSDEGLRLWDAMSAKDAARYDAGALDHRWHGFGKSKSVVTVGTLLMHAKAGGYVEAVTFEPDPAFADDEPATPASILERAKGIKPWHLPGFAGRLYRWIEGQCLYPKPTISAGAALYVLSCLGGMRHRDARDGMGLNLMIFSVAGSGTGKESVFQAVTKLFSRVKVSQAMHGKIKSEQEIYRNLLRHQAAYYLIDEIGIMLQKIAQASKSGGAIYLTGVIGALMEIYSKSTGILTITGDLKEEIKTKLKDEVAKLYKRLDSGDGKAAEIEAEIDRTLKSIQDADQGILEPFLSLMGTTTPDTFDATITPDNVKNGFVARALVLREDNTNPRKKEGFSKVELDDSIVMRLQSLHHGGHSEPPGGRVERCGDFVDVTTSADASELLEAAYEHFWKLGELHRSHTGMEAITRRSWEMCSKISLILGMADGGHRTAEHVLYGFALAADDTALKIRYARANDDTDAGKDTQRVLAMLSETEWLARFKVNRALKTNGAGCQDLIDQLVMAGKILVEQRKAGRKTAEFLKLA